MSVLATPTVAATLHVPGDYPDIQSAINASVNGDVIEVGPGNFIPAATLNTLGKAITLRGTVNADGSLATAIDGLGNKQVLKCVSGEGAGTVLENLVITNGSATQGAGVYLLSSSPTLVNCVIAGNSTLGAAGYGGAMYIKSAHPALVRCALVGNVATYSGGAIYLNGASATMTDCRIADNTAGFYGGGVHLTTFGSTLTFTGTVFCGNAAQVGKHIYGTNWTSGGGNCFADSCTDTDGDGTPDQCGTVGDGLHLVPSEFPTVEAAVAAAGAGDVIDVAAGTYMIAATIDIWGKRLTIRGATSPDGSPATIVDGQNLRRVIQCEAVDAPGAVLENLVITRGKATWGGGVYLSSTNLELRNCRFESNTAAAAGGGLYATQSSLVLTNCIFTGNVQGPSAGSGGGAALDQSDAILTNCDFDLSVATGWGGGLRMTGSSGTITNCRFRNNALTGVDSLGGGLGLYASSPTLSSCTIEGNWCSGLGGGMFLEFSAPTLTDCALVGNLADFYGGAISAGVGSELALVNCSLTGNHAWSRGGAIYCYGVQSPTITNCVFGANQAPTGGAVYLVDSIPSPQIADTAFCANASTTGGAIYGASWDDLGGNCFTSSCDDTDGGGWPDACQVDVGDFDLDGVIGGGDLALLLSVWGALYPPWGDLTGDGLVNGADVARLFAKWGESL